MSDCQSRWCHWPHLSPIRADSCFDQGAGASLRHCCVRDRPPPPTSLLIPCSGPHCISVRSPAGEEAKKDGSPLPSKEERSLRQEFDPWTDDITWREIVNYLSAALISSPPLKILYLNLSATGNKVFVKRPSFWLHDGLFAVTDLPHHCSYFVFVRKKKKKSPQNPVKKSCVQAQHEEWVILSDALRAERPSLWPVQPCLTRRREGRACVLAGVRACELPCVCVRVYGGETLFLDVTAQPSLPLLSNTSLLFRGFHRRPAIRKTRSPACGPAGAARQVAKVHTGMGG